MRTEYTEKIEAEFEKQVYDNYDTEESKCDSDGISKKIETEIIIELCETERRSFGEGLTEFIKKQSDYEGDPDDVDKKADYIWKKLKKIGYTTKPAVTSWFKNESNHPNRSTVYSICMALELDIDKVKWLFGHVYQEKSFNCRDVEDAVYYVALKSKRLPYTEAKKIIEKADKMKKNTGYDENDTDVIYTAFVMKELDKISESENPREELYEYIKANLGTFMQYNNTSRREVNKLLSDIKGDEKINDEIMDGLRKLNTYNKNILNEINISEQLNKARKVLEEIRLLEDKASLPLRELCIYNIHEYDIGTGSFSEALEAVDNISINSNAYLLRCIYLGTSSHTEQEKRGITTINNIKNVKIGKKSYTIPLGLLNHFPGEKILSTVTKNDKAVIPDKAYDGIRKLIILLKFYKFWAKYKIENRQDNSYKNPFISDAFIEETNALLCDCGYGDLYRGNPYDHLFMLLSETSSPLDIFRDIINIFVLGENG